MQKGLNSNHSPFDLRRLKSEGTVRTMTTLDLGTRKGKYQPEKPTGEVEEVKDGL